MSNIEQSLSEVSGNLLTFVYSYSKNPNLVNFKKKYVKTKFMRKKVIVKVLFTSPFLIGNRSTVDLVWMPKEDLKISNQR